MSEVSIRQREAIASVRSGTYDGANVTFLSDRLPWRVPVPFYHCIRLKAETAISSMLSGELFWLDCLFDDDFWAHLDPLERQLAERCINNLIDDHAIAVDRHGMGPGYAMWYFAKEPDQRGGANASMRRGSPLEYAISSYMEESDA